MITSVLNNAVTAPTNSSIDCKTEQGIDCPYICDADMDTIKCRINKVLESIDEIGLSDIIYELAECENGFKETGCGDNGASCGFLQFQQPTWQAFDCQGSRYNIEDSVRCGVKLIRKGIGHTTAGWKNCWRIKNLPIIKDGY